MPSEIIHDTIARMCECFADPAKWNPAHIATDAQGQSTIHNGGKAVAWNLTGGVLCALNANNASSLVFEVRAEILRRGALMFGSKAERMRELSLELTHEQVLKLLEPQNDN